MTIFIIILVILTFVLCALYKVKIKWKTFFKRGFLPVRGNFGIYCYCGKQGTGKTYSVVEYLLDNKKDIVVFSNISGISNIDYFDFVGFDELVKLKKIIDYTDKNITQFAKSLGFSNFLWTEITKA